jgi:putative Mg2+ transporter-C (MgtC) family protein
MRTTMLVGLAAAVAMILANELLTLRGREADSFVRIDVMRLPLGILSGMGFIGAAAVFHADGIVVGVTTAATLWFVSVIGLCFGGGETLLGGVAFTFCLAVLSVVRLLEGHLSREHHGTLSIRISPGGPTDDALRDLLRGAGVGFERWSMRYGRAAAHRAVRCELRWHSGGEQTTPPSVVEHLAKLPGVEEVGFQHEAF